VDAPDRRSGSVSSSTLAWILGVGAGAVAAAPVALLASRKLVIRRALELAVSSRARTRTRTATLGPLGAAAHLARQVSLGPVGRVVRGLVVRRRTSREAETLRRELPLVSDLLAVAVGAGCTPFLAVRATVGWVPSGSSRHLGEVLRACELGVGFDDALRRLGASVPVLLGLSDALATSERTGAPVGAALARTADDARAAVRRATEARARTVPVRLLFPLVFLVLPAFGLLTVVPALLTAFARA
jgi:tight adherence protein C